MNIVLTAKNFELTDALKSYIEKRFDFMEKFSSYIIAAELIMEEQRGQYSGTLKVKVKRQTLTVKSTEKDPYILVDTLKDKIKHQLVKYEEKLQDRRS
ncbi:MAG: ribosome-associated translation inhibitor RaiA [candidate division WOR-3 bacterium]